MVIFHSYASLPEGKIHWLTIVVAKTTTAFDNSWVSHIFGRTKIVMGRMMVSWSAWNGTWFPSLKQTKNGKPNNIQPINPRRRNGVKQQSIDDMSMLGTLGPKRSETNTLSLSPKGSTSHRCSPRRTSRAESTAAPVEVNRGVMLGFWTGDTPWWENWTVQD